GPRRAPVTHEGRAIVDAVLDATERLLLENGFDRLTTNGVAELAGVSVGAPYQYFPSKEALIAALGRRMRAEQPEPVAPTVDERRDQPVAAVFAAVARRLVRADAARWRHRRELIRQIPPSWLDASGEPEPWESLREMLVRRAGEARGTSPAVVAFVAY